MNAAILSVGTEILFGQIVNTNCFSFLLSEVYRHSCLMKRDNKHILLCQKRRGRSFLYK